ncbi:MAG: hypothetical protein U9Q30_03800 [Campylobacterota bacterium]|nr:hypothetical protein [Campylobacterota bacterium]
MKLLKFLIVSLFIGLFVGCTSTISNISNKSETNQFENLTSKQVEEKINWRYCEESY